jgi:alanyl-tRNA synthetase
MGEWVMNTVEYILEVVNRRLVQHGFPEVEVRTGVLPPQTDRSTLFVCSGMQPLRDRFLRPDGGKLSTLQTCVRTVDLEEVGDGRHLSSFGMLGSFHFGGGDYSDSCRMWSEILSDLGIRVDEVHVHPTQSEHRRLWETLGHTVVDDPECVWDDGQGLGGYCCEVYVGGLELGNLVHTLGHSVDVGFGLERLVQVVEGKSRVDETSLFRQDCHPVVRDHERTVNILLEQGVGPGNRGREYVCRRLVRRILPLLPEGTGGEVVERERRLQSVCVQTLRRAFRRYRDRDDEFFRSTFGVTPEDVSLVREEVRCPTT